MPIPTVLKAQIATTPATPNKTVLAALVTGALHPDIQFNACGPFIL